MTPSSTNSPQSNKGGTSISDGDAKNAKVTNSKSGNKVKKDKKAKKDAKARQEEKAKRDEKLKKDIDEIWTEIDRDVEELSKPPEDKKERKWDARRVFGDWHWGRNKKHPDATEKTGDSTERKTDPTTEILGIMEELNPELAIKKSEAHEKLRNTVTNTIQCINILGKTAASGASTVFAQAPLCFEAISFFLRFWLNYVELLEKLEELLAKCNDFIGRLHIYDLKNTADDAIELRYIAAQLMGHLVKILRFSVAIRLKKEVFKSLGKQSFLGVSEINELVTKMSVLVEREHNLLTFLSYKDIGNIKQVMSQQKVAADAKACRAAISKALGFANDEPKQLWMNKLEEIRHSLLPNTGDWVLKSSEFTSWMSLPTDSNYIASDVKPFLVIEGPENTGKSYLMANIVNHLEPERPDHTIAYYFHDRGADRQMDQKRTLSLASRCLLWQCATSLGVLMKTMADKCQEIGYNPNVDNMWSQLFLQNTRLCALKTCFYIVVDGLDEGLKQMVPVLEALVDRYPHNFRVLITSRGPDVGKTLRKELRFRVGQTINNHDVDLYIQHHLDSMPAFDGSSHPKTNEYRQNIMNQVKRTTKGDFAWITIIFERLRPKHHLKEIDQVLEDMGHGRDRQIQDEIKRLNANLSSPEIQEINEVITWVLTSQTTPTLDTMNAVLAFGCHSESLMPLRRRINPLLQANESDRIEFRLAEIRKQIPRKHKLSDSKAIARETSSVQLVDAERESVHRFLKYVSPRIEDYDKLGLERLMWGDSMDSKKTTITYDETNAHLRIALTCLQVFSNNTKENEDHAGRLLPYAGNFLLHHLSKSRAQEVDVDLKAKLGTSLTALFQEESCIDKMFWTRNESISHTAWLETEGKWLRGNRERWLYRHDGIDEMVKWFSHLITTNNIQATGWVKDLVDKRNSARLHEILLQRIAERLATHLFMGTAYTTREQQTAVYFLSAYLARVDNRKDIQIYLRDRDCVSWEELKRIIEWATESTKVGKNSDKKSWLWKIQTARTILAICEADAEAMKTAKAHLQDVQNSKDTSWKDSILACQTIADQLRSDKLYTQAQGILENATHSDNLSAAGTETRKSKSDLLQAAIALLDLGDLYWRKDAFGLHQRGQAIEKYRQSLTFDATRYGRYIRVLRRYQEQNWQSQIIDFVGDLTEGRDFDKVYLKRLVYEFLAEDELQHAILLARSQEKWNQVLDRTFEKAIEAAEDSPVEAFFIMKAYGDILHRSGDKTKQDDAVSKWETALKYGKPLATTTCAISWSDIFSVIDPLVYIYLQRAETALLDAKQEVKVGSKPDNKSMRAIKSNFDIASHYRSLIEGLEQKTDIWMNTTVTCCLARYHKTAGNAVKSTVSKLVAASLGVLSDDDESNDWFAYLQLWRIMEALQDEQNAEAARKRLESNSSAADFSNWPCNVCKKDIRLDKGLHIFLQSFQPKAFHRDCRQKLNDDSSQNDSAELQKVAVIPSRIGNTDTLSTADQKKEREMLNHWKISLQLKYVHPKDSIDFSENPSMSIRVEVPEGFNRARQRKAAMASVATRVHSDESDGGRKRKKRPKA